MTKLYFGEEIFLINRYTSRLIRGPADILWTDASPLLVPKIANVIASEIANYPRIFFEDGDHAADFKNKS